MNQHHDIGTGTKNLELFNMNQHHDIGTGTKSWNEDK